MDRRTLLTAMVGVGVVSAASAAAGVGAAAPAKPGVPAGNTANALLRRRIPSTGEELPVIGLGTSGPFEVAPGSAAVEPLREVLAAYFEAGATLIDTSPMYSTAEDVIGSLLTPAMQRKAFLATKVWTRGEDAGVAQMQRSATRLKRERLDLVQVHNLLDLETQLATLRKWKDQGRVRYVGITHYTVGAHEELARVISREKPDFVQFNYSAVTRNAEEKLLPLCAERGVAVLVNRAFEDGELFTRVRGRPVPEWAREFDATSWGQIFLKYVLAHPAVTCVIPATGKVRNALDNLGAGRGRLPDAAQKRRIVEAI